MKLNWKKWGLEFWRSVARHTASCGVAYFAVIETQSLPFTWKGLGTALLAGGLVKAALTFFASSPAPEDEDEHKSAEVKP